MPPPPEGDAPAPTPASPPEQVPAQEPGPENAAAPAGLPAAAPTPAASRRVTRDDLEAQHRARPPKRRAWKEREAVEQSPFRNYVRDIVLGFNDGLVSVYAVVAGVVGAGFAASGVALAGIAATVAGALSMGIGEYISTKSQTEYYAAEREMERRHIRDYPELEKEELTEYLEQKGIHGEALQQVLDNITSDPERFLDVMMLEEFGHSPETERSALLASGMIMVAFVVGAVLAVVPFFFLEARPAVWLATGLSLTGLLAAGGVKAWVSGLPVTRSALEMAALGAGAALVTYGVGRLVGFSV